MSDALPIDALRSDFEVAFDAGPVVLSSPTGSGKSTQVPRWLRRRAPGSRVLVVEPRRVACSSLAARVADLEGDPLGAGVGYVVRDDARATDATEVVFATPGVVLRLGRDLDRYGAVVLDEFHERRLDVDLLLALLIHRRAPLVVMSATLDGDRIAEHLGGRHLSGEGRRYPVEIEHVPGGATLPELPGLEGRVLAALEQSRGVPGDVLVFLPGKGEIASVSAAVTGARGAGDWEIVPLHGGLTLAQQGAVFRSASRRKLVLATNVAETSLTVPGVGVVIDAGLVRRTRYREGRGFLTLSPIAMDAAEQRAGRAGRTGPGVCFRLWDPRARLETRTPPEVHRESLVPLLLGAAASGVAWDRLPFLDPPKDHAVSDARAELAALGALDEADGLTATGRELFGLPLDAWLGRLLVEGRGTSAADDVVDLVAALAVGRPLFVGTPGPDDDLRGDGCDVVGLVRALRRGRGDDPRLSGPALKEARRTVKRLRAVVGLSSDSSPKDAEPDRDRLLRTILRADPRAAYVARRHGKRVGWANGGTEVEVGRDSALTRRDDVDAAVLLEVRALGTGPRGTRLVASIASAVTPRFLASCGVGRDRVGAVSLEGGRLVARVERVHAGRVLTTTESEPTGALARDAIAELVGRGTLFKGLNQRIGERLASRRLLARLARAGRLVDWGYPDYPAPPEMAAFLRDKLDELGLESSADLGLLGPGDLLPDAVPPELQAVLDDDYPRRIDLGGAVYSVDYDLDRNQALLRLVKGRRDKPPPATYLPKLPGFRVFVEAGGTVHPVRGR